jgi:hypothetical protein
VDLIKKGYQAGIYDLEGFRYNKDLVAIAKQKRIKELDHILYRCYFRPSYELSDLTERRRKYSVGITGIKTRSQSPISLYNAAITLDV